MNNKGYTLVELIGIIGVLGIITVTVVTSVQTTFSLNNEKAYEVLKNNIISISNTYLTECTSKTIDCDLSWVVDNDDTYTTFKLTNLIQSGYFNQNIINPITNKDISECLIIKANKKNSVYQFTVDDTLCK